MSRRSIYAVKVQPTRSCVWNRSLTPASRATLGGGTKYGNQCGALPARLPESNVPGAAHFVVPLPKYPAPEQRKNGLKKACRPISLGSRRMMLVIRCASVGGSRKSNRAQLFLQERVEIEIESPGSGNRRRPAPPEPISRDSPVLPGPRFSG